MNGIKFCILVENNTIGAIIKQWGEIYMKTVGKETNFSVDFRVMGNGNMQDVFDSMKEYQNAGVADEHSNIIFNGVTVPAGYYEDFDQAFGLYHTIVTGETENLSNYVPEGLTEMQLMEIMYTTSEEMEKLGKAPISEDMQTAIIESKAVKNQKKI